MEIQESGQEERIWVWKGSVNGRAVKRSRVAHPGQVWRGEGQDPIQAGEAVPGRGVEAAFGKGLWDTGGGGFQKDSAGSCGGSLRWGRCSEMQAGSGPVGRPWWER